jgi:hypothetical protein
MRILSYIRLTEYKHGYAIKSSYSIDLIVVSAMTRETGIDESAKYRRDVRNREIFNEKVQAAVGSVGTKAGRGRGCE